MVQLLRSYYGWQINVSTKRKRKAAIAPPPGPNNCPRLLRLPILSTSALSRQGVINRAQCIDLHILCLSNSKDCLNGRRFFDEPESESTCAETPENYVLC